MRARRFAILLAAEAALCAAAFGDNGSYAGTGGTFATGYAIGASITITAVPVSGSTASASLSCPLTSFGAGTYQWNWACAGGTVSISSTDQSVSLTGAFTSGSMTLSGSGGGKGGHTTYWYVFSGKFQGTVSSGGTTEAVLGSISFQVKTTSQIGSGSAAVTTLAAGWNSAYSPVVVADAANARLLEADNLLGANLTTYGSAGSGAGQFTLISGLAQDGAGRIYIADSVLNRIVRIDDLTGKNWTEIGSTGSGKMQLSGPRGVAIDGQGKIWVADAGNNRVVRFDDMTGANWTSFGTAGAGANQFNAPAAVALDAQGRIYVGDTGNGRLARFDDLSGTNWVTLSQLNIDPYGYPLAGVNAVSVSPAGKIFVATAAGWLLRMDDMTGTNGEAAWWQPSIGGMSLDSAGTVYLSGGFSPPLAQTLDAIGTGEFGGDLGIAGVQPGAMLALASTTPAPAAGLLSATALHFPSRNVGEPGGSQSVTLSNFGGTPLAVSSVSAGADYLVTNGCTTPIAGGASCTIGVQFDPTATGGRSGTLQIESNGAHALLAAALSGTGTAPKASLMPGALIFEAQKIGTTSGVEQIELTNPGTGPLTIASITATGDFSAGGNCPAVLYAGAGCMIQVMFKPTASGARAGSLVVSDDLIPAGAQQSIALAGTGAATAPGLSFQPESLYFASQKVATVSATQTVKVSNTSTQSAALGTPVFPAGFAGTTTCGKSLAAGASCVVRVEFAPVAAGTLTSTLRIPVPGKVGLSVGLVGAGVAGGQRRVLTANPTSISFPSLVVNDQESQTVVISNPTRLPMGVQSLKLTGSGVFSITQKNCPSLLQGGASCTVQITFSPTAMGFFSGTLKLTESSGAVTAIAITGATESGN